jgi:hypothetical protein
VTFSHLLREEKGTVTWNVHRKMLL